MQKIVSFVAEIMGGSVYFCYVASRILRNEILTVFTVANGFKTETSLKLIVQFLFIVSAFVRFCLFNKIVLCADIWRNKRLID